VFALLVLAAGIAFVIALGMCAQIFTAWLRARSPKDSSATGSGQMGPAFTGLWRPTRSADVGVLARVSDISMDHPGYRGRTSQTGSPPSIRIGILIACEPLGLTAPATSDLRNSFLNFLRSAPISSLIRSLTYVDFKVGWKPWGGHGPVNVSAVLTSDDPQAPPVAWARLDLAEADITDLLANPRCAQFTLHIEPRTPAGQPAPAATLHSWYDRLTQILGLSSELGAFIPRDLRLATWADPPAQIGICLATPHSMTELIDIRGFTVVPGSVAGPSFSGYVTADPDGQPAATLARQLLRRICDYTLCLNNYEKILDGITSQQNLPPRADRPSDPPARTLHPRRQAAPVTASNPVLTRLATPAGTRGPRARPPGPPATHGKRILLGGLITCVLLAGGFLILGNILGNLHGSAGPSSPPTGHPSTTPTDHPSTTPTAQRTAAPPTSPEATFHDPGTKQVNALAFSPDGKTLALGDCTGNCHFAGSGPSTGNVALFKLANHALIATLTDPESNTDVDAVAFSPNGRFIAAGDSFGSTYLRNPASGTLVATLTDPNTDGVNALAFSANSAALAVGDWDGSTYLWNPETGTLITTLTDPVAGDVDSVAISSDGKTVAAADSDPYLWKLAAGTRASALSDPCGKNILDGVAFSPDGTTLAGACLNSKTYLWNVATGKITAAFTDPSSVDAVAFSPDGKALVTGDSNGSTYVRNLATGKVTAILADPGSDADVAAVAFNPDGTTLAVGDLDGSAYLWNMNWLGS
jgi:sugar lactone lactonase YvrE